MSAATVVLPSASATYAQRVAFVSEIAGRLHSYGTTAQRLEAALVGLSQKLGLTASRGPTPPASS